MQYSIMNKSKILINSSCKKLITGQLDKNHVNTLTFKKYQKTCQCDKSH